MHLATFIFIELIKLSDAFNHKFLLIPSLFSSHQLSNFIFIHYVGYFHFYLIQTYFLEDSIYSQMLLKILKMLEKPFYKSNQLHVADLELFMICCSIFLVLKEMEVQYNWLLKNYFFFHYSLEIAYPVENSSNFERNDFVDQGMNFLVQLDFYHLKHYKQSIKDFI